ncbi:MAG: methyltransferase domain-containing protein [Clostridiales bacterium]|nr:methyltransferase domain-containing protein [Clostridiales bacterium]
MMTHEEKMKLIIDGKYPLAAKYDPEWMFENKMGGQCLWLAESLTRIMDLKPGMRVLDMGCGKALTSIFLAKEFGVTVFANDLWISPSDNWQRICEAGVQDLVFPIYGEAHALPYANDFFDAIISINSFQMYGTADNYLIDYMAHLLRLEGQFGIAVWGPDAEFAGKVPADMEADWWPDFFYFHSLDWWKWHFEKTKLFTVEAGDDLDGDGVRVTRQWAKIMDKYDPTHNNETMRWNRLVARRNHYQADDFRK